MPALSSIRVGYLQSPIKQTGSLLVLASRSGFECGQSGVVLLTSAMVTTVTTLWEGVLDLWSGHAVFSRVYGVSLRGCCGFVVTPVTNAVYAVPPIHYGEFLYAAPRCRCCPVGASG